jgi:hypothetical protein
MAEKEPTQEYKLFVPNQEIVLEIPLNKLRITVTQTPAGTKAFLGFTHLDFKEFVNTILKAYGEKVEE